jgi:hypothetical protein
VHLERADTARVRRAYQPVYLLARELIGAAIEAGAIRSDIDADAISQYIPSLVRQVSQAAIADRSPHPTGTELWDLIANGVVSLQT